MTQAESEIRGGLQMKKNESLPALVGGTIVVAVLTSLSVQSGWLIWIPVVLAIAVVYHIGRTPGR
jgi:hypothetical protein